MNKYWKISPSWPQKMPARFHRFLKRFICEWQSLSCRLVHLTVVLGFLKISRRKIYRHARVGFQTVLENLLKLLPKHWKLTKYWKIGLSFPSKSLAIFLRILIKIKWYYKVLCCVCVHLSMVWVPLKCAGRQSYRSSKIGFQTILHQLSKTT